MARVRVAGVDAVAAGLGLSPRQVHRHAARLQADGFVARPRLADRAGGIMVVTPRGAREAGYEFRSGSRPTSSALQHGRGVSWIAALCERSCHPWAAPLELRDSQFELKLLPRAGAAPRTHLADLGLYLEKERWAVEFERTQKSYERLRSILSGYRTAELTGELRGALYVCATPRIEKVVNRLADEIQLNLATRPLEWVIRMARDDKPAPSASVGFRSLRDSG